jgi:hypothetical protein
LNVAGTSGLNWVAGGNSSGLVTIGTGGTTGGSLWVNTPSVNSTYHSGLGITGAYGTPAFRSVVNINAYGANVAGTYGSDLAFSTTNGAALAEAMRIDKFGNVGLGNTAPNAKLEVDGNIYIPLGAGNIGIGTSVPRAALVVGSDATLTYAFDGGSAYVQKWLEVDGAIYLPDGTRVASSADLGGAVGWTKSGAKVYVTSSADSVGIGTSVPGASLEITKQAGGVAPLMVSSAATLDGDYLIVTSLGNVGIGTTVPAGTFEVKKSGSAPPVMISSGANTDGDYLTVTSAGNVGMGTSVPNANLEVQKTGAVSPFMISSGATLDGDYFVVTSAGNVGIGTTSPGTAFDVVAATGNGVGLRITNVTTDATEKAAKIVGRHYTNANRDVMLIFSDSYVSQNDVIFGGGSASQNAATRLMFNTAANTNTATGTVRMTVDSSGNLGIGTITPASRLEVSGAGTSGISSFMISSATTLHGDYFVVSSEGSIGIGSTAPRAKLEIAGGAAFVQEKPLTAAAVITVDWSQGTQQYVTLNQAGHTINFSNVVPGETMRLVLCQDGSGSRTVTTWDASIDWSGGSAPVLTTTLNKCDIVAFVSTLGKGSLRVFGSATRNF